MAAVGSAAGRWQARRRGWCPAQRSGAPVVSLHHVWRRVSTTAARCEVRKDGPARSPSFSDGPDIAVSHRHC